MPKSSDFCGNESRQFVEMARGSVVCRNRMGFEEGRQRPGVPGEAKILHVKVIPPVHAHGGLSTQHPHSGAPLTPCLNADTPQWPTLLCPDAPAWVALFPLTSL